MKKIAYTVDFEKLKIIPVAEYEKTEMGFPLINNEKIATNIIPLDWAVERLVAHLRNEYERKIKKIRKYYKNRRKK